MEYFSSFLPLSFYFLLIIIGKKDRKLILDDLKRERKIDNVLEDKNGK